MNSEEIITIGGGDSKGLDAIEAERREVAVVGIDKINELGEIWQGDIEKIKRCGRSIEERDPSELKKYLECVSLQVKTAKELQSIMSGGDGDGKSLLEKLGLDV